MKSFLPSSSKPQLFKSTNTQTFILTPSPCYSHLLTSSPSPTFAKDPGAWVNFLPRPHRSSWLAGLCIEPGLFAPWRPSLQWSSLPSPLSHSLTCSHPRTSVISDEPISTVSISNSPPSELGLLPFHSPALVFVPGNSFLTQSY